MRVLATRSLRAGEFVHLSYGTMTNAQLLSQYGFVLPGNEHDEVEVQVSDILADAGQLHAVAGVHEWLWRESVAIRYSGIPHTDMAALAALAAAVAQGGAAAATHRTGGERVSAGARALAVRIIDSKMASLPNPAGPACHPTTSQHVAEIDGDAHIQVGTPSATRGMLAMQLCCEHALLLLHARSALDGQGIPVHTAA